MEPHAGNLSPTPSLRERVSMSPVGIVPKPSWCSALVGLAASAGVNEARVVVHHMPCPTLEDLRGQLDGQFVLYHCTRAPRSAHNEALEAAKALANSLRLPLVVLYAVSLQAYARNSVRHVAFLLEGLAELEGTLATANVRLEVRVDAADGPSSLLGGATDDKVVEGFVDHAAAVVCDAPCMTVDVATLSELVCAAQKRNIPVVQVDNSVVIPTSDVTEWNADTYEGFLVAFEAAARPFVKALPSASVDAELTVEARDLDVSRLGHIWPHETEGAGGEGPERRSSWTATTWLANDFELRKVLRAASIDTTATVLTTYFRGGERRAAQLLATFMSTGLRGYENAALSECQIPAKDYGSQLSPYFCTGFLSTASFCAALVAEETKRATKLHTTVIWRSIGKRDAAHWAIRTDPTRYASYKTGVPDWVQDTLANSPARRSRRVYTYSLSAWRRGSTHDSRWNTVMRELRLRGRNQARDRAFWMAMIIAYEADPAEALRVGQELNYKEMIDAGPGDPNSVIGCLLAFGLFRKPPPDEAPESADLGRLPRVWLGPDMHQDPMTLGACEWLEDGDADGHPALLGSELASGLAGELGGSSQFGGLRGGGLGGGLGGGFGSAPGGGPGGGLGGGMGGGFGSVPGGGPGGGLGGGMDGGLTGGMDGFGSGKLTSSKSYGMLLGSSECTMDDIIEEDEEEGSFF